MPQQELIVEAVEMLRNGNDDLDITLFLKENGLEPAETKEVIDAARNEFLIEKLKYLPKRNKAIFILWLVITTAVLLADLFVLPGASRIGYSTMLSMAGSAAFILCGYLAI